MALLKIRRKGEKSAIDTDEKNILPLNKDRIGISEAACKKILELQSKNGHTYFRIALRGGGCSGLTINFEFTNDKKDNDYNFSNKDAHILIDKKSLSFLGGSTLHFRDYYGSGEFVLINNPAAKQCSCGKSFSL